MFAIRSILSAFAVTVSLSSASFAASGEDTMSDCSKFVDAWKAAYNAKDANALAAMYDAKTGQYSSAFWTAAGHDGLVQGFGQELSLGPHMDSITCDESTRYGDVGISKGTYAATVKGPNGADMPIGGHWLSTVAVRDGNYFILTHNSNMQMPPPPK